MREYRLHVSAAASDRKQALLAFVLCCLLRIVAWRPPRQLKRLMLAICAFDDHAASSTHELLDEWPHGRVQLKDC